MTGQQIIDYIQNGKLQDRHFFISVDGCFSNIGQVMENEHGDIIFSQCGRNANEWNDNCQNKERYFSEWFNLISYSDAKQLWENGNRIFLVLANDGSDRYADSFETWEELTETFQGALFGLERM